jgi:hypothetical protein
LCEDLVFPEIAAKLSELRPSTDFKKSESVPQQPPVPPLPVIESQIISDFPEIFPEFQGQAFSLLWRGSSDGFTAKDFHRRCDGHANTLTVILDTQRNIFGGFTPLEWEMAGIMPVSKADDSLKSFLFTLKNLHNIPPKRFALKPEKKKWAIKCFEYSGPSFGAGVCDIEIRGECNKFIENFTCLGHSYINDTGLDMLQVFTGSYGFTVEEIEVFEMRD